MMGGGVKGKLTALSVLLYGGGGQGYKAKWVGWGGGGGQTRQRTKMGNPLKV